MPVDYRKYPPNWKSEIRPAILERAKNACEVCGVKNYTIVEIDSRKKKRVNLANGFKTYWEAKEAIPRVIIERKRFYPGEYREQDKKYIVVVLTIAHLNHDVSDNRPENLKALCQLHHLQHDKEIHAKNSRQTRRKKLGIPEITFTSS